MQGSSSRRFSETASIIREKHIVLSHHLPEEEAVLPLHRPVAPRMQFGYSIAWRGEHGNRDIRRRDLHSLCEHAGSDALRYSKDSNSGWLAAIRTYPFHSTGDLGGTNNMTFQGIPNIYQLASNRVDVLVKKTDTAGDEAVLEGVLPWLTLYFDNNFKLVIAALIHYEKPNRKVFADLQSEVMMLDDDLQPDEVHIDNGLEFAHLLHTKSQFKYVTQRHVPSRKQNVESFFKLLDMFWMTVPGYIGSKGPEKSREVTAQLTLEELRGLFEAFMRSYNRNHPRYYGS
jgi:hypothetical protein